MDHEGTKSTNEHEGRHQPPIARLEKAGLIDASTLSAEERKLLVGLGREEVAALLEAGSLDLRPRRSLPLNFIL